MGLLFWHNSRAQVCCGEDLCGKDVFMNYTQQENCGSKEGFMGKELLMGHCCGFKVSTERIYEGKNGGATEKLKMPTWVCERCKTQSRKFYDKSIWLVKISAISGT